MIGNRYSEVSQNGNEQPNVGAAETPAREKQGVQPDCSVIVVSWNTHDYLALCLHSILSDPSVAVASEGSTPAGQLSQTRVEIIVVDNASIDGSAEMVAANFPQVRLLVNNRNLGFAAANNQAIAQASGRVLFLLNPDAYVRPGALHTLVGFLDERPGVAAAGPNVLNPDGTWQAAAFRFATLWDLFCEAVFLSVLFPHSRLFARKELGGFDRDRVRRVDWIQGCALAIRREAWDAVGPFDEGYWMYVEELDWCRRANQQGYRLYFTPDAEVVHYGKRATAKARASVLPLGFRSHFRYFRKFDGRATELTVRAITFVQMGLRAGVSVVMIALGNDRDRWRENLRAYTAVMREALRSG